MDRQQRRANRYDKTLTRGESRELSVDCSPVGYVDIRDDSVALTVEIDTPTGKKERTPTDDSVTVEDARSVSVTFTPEHPGVYRLRVFVTDDETTTAVPTDGPIAIWVQP